MSVIEEILKDISFTCVDAGAAGGLNDLKNLQKFINLHSFEPQLSSYNELKTDNSAFKQHNVYNDGLYSSKGKFELNIASRPSMSSMLKFDDKTFVKHFGYCAGSAGWKKALTQTTAIEINTTTLDEWSTENKVTNIDFLKLDTQGTELEILRGVARLLKNGKINVIKTEFSNFAVYKNQCLLTELDAFLKSAGFNPVDYIYYPDITNTNGENVHNNNLLEVPHFGAGGDAVYVLDEDRLDKQNTVKCGIILGSMGYFGMANHILEAKSGLDRKTIYNILLEIAPKESFKKKIKELIPPAILKLRK